MNYLKNLRFLFLLIFAASLVVSCSDENLDEKEVIEGEITPTTKTENELLTRTTTVATGEGLSFDCFKVIYPFNLLDENGGSYTVNTDDDFLNLLDGNVAIADFEYPINIENEDGTTATVADATALGKLFANCLPNDWDREFFPAYLINESNSCWDIAYPIDVENYNGDITAINDENELVAAISTEEVFFVFPFELVDSEGTSTIVDDVEALITALISCNDFEIDTTIWSNDSTDWSYDFEYFGCYMLNFPFNVELVDGTIVTVNDHMEYCDLLLQGSMLDFTYPLTLTDEEGNEIVVNTSQELYELLDECYDGPGFSGGDAIILYLSLFTPDSTGQTLGCFEITYPMSVEEIDFEGNILGTITLNSDAEFTALPGIIDGTRFYNIVYPFSVLEDGSTSPIQLEDFGDFIDLLNNC